MLRWYWGPIKGKVFSSGQKNGIKNFKIHTEVHSGWANLHFHSVVNNVETLLIFCWLTCQELKWIISSIDLSFCFCFIYIPFSMVDAFVLDCCLFLAEHCVVILSIKSSVHLILPFARYTFPHPPAFTSCAVNVSFVEFAHI